ncbi:MAG TPA: hypothetical protein VNO81_02295 [Candidatus Nitrosotenuis sp.]|jgi:hypothetical protein|nr:hypothetical protein [Candidatus Nitrosotenuis sp.]
MRISSAAFDDTDDNAMSVYLRSKLMEIGKQDASILEGWQHCGIVAIRVKDIRDAGMGVHYDGNPPGHALVINLQRRRKSKADRRRLRDAARWVKRPPGME